MPNPFAFTQELDRANWSAVIHARKGGVSWDRLVNSEGLRALHLAVLMGETLIVQNLLRQGAPAGAYADGTGRVVSPLWDAIRRDEDTIATALIHAGADPTASDPHVPSSSDGPLVAASQRGLASTTLALLDRGVSLRPLSVAQRAQVFEGWFRAPIGPSTEKIVPALQVIQALADSGWYPTGAEAVDLGQRLMNTPTPHAATETALHRLLACWRERQSGAVSPQTAVPRRVRS